MSVDTHGDAQGTRGGAGAGSAGDTSGHAQSDVERARAGIDHPRRAHYFHDLDQQLEASTLGMWVFLVTEIMFFGGLFAGYAVYRYRFPQGFAEGSHHLDVLLGGINTAVLICSSLTMALAVHAAQTSKKKALIGFLVATMALGGVFLGIKGLEYHHKYEEGLVPGAYFHYVSPDAGPLEIFFSFYFAMTGMHALHMVIGVGLMLWLVARAWRGHFDASWYTPVEIVGLYWHFVDIVWIFLFPLLYLIGRHTA